MANIAGKIINKFLKKNRRLTPFGAPAIAFLVKTFPFFEKDWPSPKEKVDYLLLTMIKRKFQIILRYRFLSGLPSP